MEPSLYLPPKPPKKLFWRIIKIVLKVVLGIVAVIVSQVIFLFLLLGMIFLSCGDSGSNGCEARGLGYTLLVIALFATPWFIFLTIRLRRKRKKRLVV